MHKSFFFNKFDGKSTVETLRHSKVRQKQKKKTNKNKLGDGKRQSYICFFGSLLGNTMEREGEREWKLYY